MSAESDEREVLVLIDDFGAALHARDLDRSMAVLSPDPDLTVIPSEGVDVYRGPDAVRGFLARIYRADRRYGWRWHDRWVAVDGVTAAFVCRGTESVGEEGLTKLIPYCLTGTATRSRDGWRLRLLHASEDTQAATTRP